MTAKLGSALPKGTRNGLHNLAAAFIDNPQATGIVVGIVNCKSITTETETGEEIATIRFHAIEGFERESFAGLQLQRIWREAWHNRTGENELPFDDSGVADDEPDDDE